MTEIESLVSRRSVLRAAAGLAAAVAAPGLLTSCTTKRPGTQPTASIAPRRGGRLRAAVLGGSRESASILDNANTVIDIVRTRVAFDALCEIDADGRPTYHLAESVQPNTDGTVWTVRVRQGAEFTNGKPVTAADVLHSLRTYVDKKSFTSPLLRYLDLANARTSDDRTLVLPASRPFGFLELALTQGMFIFSADTTDFTKAIGSGPYLIERYQAGQGALLRRNPNYWAADRGGPYLDELELLSINDSQARLNALRAGQIDCAVSIPLTGARAEQNNHDLQLLDSPKWEWGTFGATMNRTKAPFTDPRVTQALRYAVDRELMVRNVTLGFGELGNDLLGRHLPYYPEDLPQRQYDPDRAKKLLADAGVNGLNLSIRTSDFEYGLIEGAAALAEQASRAGITLTLDKVPAADFLADPKIYLNVPFGCINRRPRPMQLDVMFFYGKDALVPFTGSVGGRLDELADRVLIAVTEEQRRATIADLQHYLYDEGGDLVWARAPSIHGATTKVHGVKSLGYAAYPSFRDAFLS